MKVLITGATGFIGSHIVRRLSTLGCSISITASSSERLPAVDRIHYLTLNGLDWDALEHYHVVIHQMANNDTTCTDWHQMKRANVDGPIKLFNECFKKGCKNFVYASSTAVYGNRLAPYLECTPPDPLNAYARSKLLFDEFAMQFAEKNQVKVTGLRYCNIYGPGEGHKGKRQSMIGQLLKQMRQDKNPVLFHPGDQRRDWCYVDEVVHANQLAIFRSHGGHGEIYNIGSGKSHTFREIVSYLNEALGKDLPIEYIDNPYESTYQNHTECKIDKAKEGLGFVSKVDLRSGIYLYINASDEDGIS